MRAVKFFCLAAVLILAVLDTVNAAAQDIVFNVFAVVDTESYNRNCLIVRVKHNRISLIGKDICLIGGMLFYVVAAERKVCQKYRAKLAFAARGNSGNLQQSIFWNGSAVNRFQLL